MGIRGFTQNEEYIGLALRQGREFIIPCKNADDANSKRVSLYNVRRTLAPEDQKKLSIQKVKFNDEWAVKISKCLPEVWEKIGDTYVLVQETSAELSDYNKDTIRAMLEAGESFGDITDAIVARGEIEERVIAAVASISKELAEKEVTTSAAIP
jgi:hypothetical protein